MDSRSDVLEAKQDIFRQYEKNVLHLLCVLEEPAVRTTPNPHLPEGEKFRPEEAKGNALESYGLCHCTNVTPQGAGYGFPAQPPCST